MQNFEILKELAEIAGIINHPLFIFRKNSAEAGVVFKNLLYNLYGRFKALLSQNLEMTEEIEKLKAEIATCKAKNSALKTKNADMRKKLRRKSNLNISLEWEIEDLKEELSNSKKQSLN